MGPEKLGLVLTAVLLLCSLNRGCAEGLSDEECGAPNSDLYDIAQVVFFMLLGAGTKQFLFGSNRLSSSPLHGVSSCSAEAEKPHSAKICAGLVANAEDWAAGIRRLNRWSAPTCSDEAEKLHSANICAGLVANAEDWAAGIRRLNRWSRPTVGCVMSEHLRRACGEHLHSSANLCTLGEHLRRACGERRGFSSRDPTAEPLKQEADALARSLPPSIFLLRVASSPQRRSDR